MRKRFGLILASGPSNAAVDELAERIVLKDGELCDRYNQSLSHGETRIRRALVLRGYQANDEVNSFNGHLKDPTGATMPKRDYGDDPPWKLVNTMTFLDACLPEKQGDGEHPQAAPRRPRGPARLPGRAGVMYLRQLAGYGNRRDILGEIRQI